MSYVFEKEMIKARIEKRMSGSGLTTREKKLMEQNIKLVWENSISGIQTKTYNIIHKNGYDKIYP